MNAALGEADLAYIAYVLTRPRAAARTLAAHQPVVGGAVVAVLGTFSYALGAILVARATTGTSSGLGFLVVLTLSALFSLGLGVAVGSVMLPFGARMVGGRGDVEELLWTLLYSYAPWLLWTPLALVYQLTPAAGILGFLTQVLMLGWVLWIQVEGLSVCYGISVLRSLFAAMLGYGLAAILFMAFWGSSALGLLTTLVLWR